MFILPERWSAVLVMVSSKSCPSAIVHARLVDSIAEILHYEWGRILSSFITPTRQHGTHIKLAHKHKDINMHDKI